MAEIPEKYIVKTNAVKQVIGQLGADWDSILNRYHGESFSNGLSKSETFKQILECDNSGGIVEKLNDLLTEGYGHMRGSRTGFEYGADLVMGWIIEDALDEALTKRNITHSLDGADSSRDFLTSRAVKASADFKVGKKDRKLELAADLTGFWKKNDKYDLRDTKYQTLAKENAVIFLIDIINQRGAVVDLTHREKYKLVEVPFHFIYKKPAMSIQGVNALLKPLESALGDLQSV